MSQKNKNIKKISCFTTNYAMFQRSEEEVEPELLSKETMFDEAGNMIKEVKYFENGAADESVTLIYDSKNRLIAETVHFELSESEEKRVIRINDEDRTEEEIIFYGDEPGEKIIRKLDVNGNVIEAVQYDEDGNKTSRIEYTYTSSNNLATEKEFDEEGELVREVINEYDADGNLVKQQLKNEQDAEENQEVEIISECTLETIITKDDNGQILITIENKYDEKENLIYHSYQSILEPYNNRKQEIEYDEKDRMIMNKVMDINGNLLRQQELEYDENGLLIEEVDVITNPMAGKVQHSRIRYEYEKFS